MYVKRKLKCRIFLDGTMGKLLSMIPTNQRMTNECWIVAD
jgi:hypothetical protein